MEHPATPRTAKWLIAVALLYAATPVDVVPDWVPVLGQLDDIVVIGVLLWLAWRLLPPVVRAEWRDSNAAT